MLGEKFPVESLMRRGNGQRLNELPEHYFYYLRLLNLYLYYWSVRIFQGQN